MSWETEFVGPIDLPNGRQLKTLHDARDYILNLPKKKQQSDEWQNAAKCLIMCAGNGSDMLARMAIMHAIHGPTPPPPRDPSKDHIHEFRNRKRRYPWR